MSSGSSTTQSSPPTQATIYGPQSFIVLAVGCTVFGVFFWFLYGQLNLSEPNVKPIAKPTDDDRQGIPEDQTPNPDSKILEDVQRQTAELKQLQKEVARQLDALRAKTVGERIAQDLQLARLGELRRIGDEISSNLEKLNTEIASWEKQRDELMTNGAGKKIATDSRQLALFASITARESPSKRDIARWQGQHSELFKTIRSMTVGASAITIPDGFLEDVNTLDDEMKRAIAAVRQKQRAVSGIESAVLSLEPGSDTPLLQDALASYRHQLARQREEFLSRETREVRDEFTAKLIEEQRRTEKELGEAALANEKRLRELELEAKKETSDAEAQAITDAVAAIRAKAEADRKQREKEALTKLFNAEYPRMKGVLVPFTSEGFWKPGGGKSDKRGPMSLTQLKAAGLLDDNPSGMQGLVNLGNADANDRPHGSFPPQSGLYTPASRRAIENIQRFINRYGEIMVEKGILAP